MNDTSREGDNAPRDTFSIEASTGREAVAAQTLAVVEKLATELRGEQGRPVLAQLDSNLDRDLGFDSLGRAELILRLDRAFRVRLPDRLINDAITPRDLVEAIGTSASLTRGDRTTSHRARANLEAISEPSAASTLVEVLVYHGKAHRDRPHVGLWLDDRLGDELSYGHLHHDALCVARGLEEAGAEPGERIAIMLPTGLGFFRTFFGILYAGCIPVPIYPPFRRAQVEDHLRRQAGILENAEAALLVTESEIRQVGKLLMGLVPIHARRAHRCVADGS